MGNYKAAGLLLLVALVAAGGTTLSARRPQNQPPEKPPRKSQGMIEQERRLPVADYSAPEPDDPRDKKKREAKAKKFAKVELSIDPDSDSVTTSSHWATGLPAIPASQSSAVIIGTVRKAKAELTPNRNKVYSEFTITINEVLKNDATSSLSSGKIITADRAGGRVRFPSGKVGLYSVTGQGMPQVERTYLLFLTEADPESDYSILTGYEILNGHIHPLDDPGSGHPFTKFKGVEESLFLEEVRTAVATTGRGV